MVASRGHTRTSRHTFLFFFQIKADLTLRCRNLRRERACRVLREYEMPDLGVQTISQTERRQPYNSAHIYTMTDGQLPANPNDLGFYKHNSFYLYFFEKKATCEPGKAWDAMVLVATTAQEAMVPTCSVVHLEWVATFFKGSERVPCYL